MTDGHLERFWQILCTDQEISSLLGTESSTGKGVIYMDIGRTSKWMCRYRSSLSTAMCSTVTLDGGGGVKGVLVPSPHPDTIQSYQRQAGSEEGLNHKPCLGCPTEAVIL